MDLIKNADIVVIDSYLAPLEIYNNISGIVKKAVYIDDFIRLAYPKGIIINGTVGAEEMGYSRDDDHEYFLGVDYIPLRKEFWDVSAKQKHADIKNLLITFGGQDIKSLTFPVLTNLVHKYPHLTYHVILGNNGNQYKTDLFDSNNILFYRHLNSHQMIDVIKICDCAISAAGQTSYELNRLGLKSILIGVIDNQKYNLSGWKEKGYIFQQLWYNDKYLFDKINDDLQKHMFQKWNAYDCQDIRMVDGQGARRIVNRLFI